jgi:hypothetical protein
MNELTPSEQHLAEQHLADQLQRQARSLDVGDTALATVVRRGRQRSEHRKVAVGVAVVVALSGTVIGTIQLLSRPVEHRIKASTDSEPGEGSVPTGTLPGVTDGAELTPVNRVDSNLVWDSVEPGSTEALGSSFWNTVGVSQSPPYLAWSTTPGKTSDQTFRPTLYRSDDGIHWTAAGGESFKQPQVSARGLGIRDGRMFAFGTAAATAPIAMGGGGDVVVDVSDDQGASWRNIVLPIDLRGLASSAGVQSVGFQGGMAASDVGVVAVGVPSLVFDSSVYDRFASGIVPTRDGVISFGSVTCGSDTGPTISVQGGFAVASSTTITGEVVAGTAPAATVAAVTPTVSPTTIGYTYGAGCTATSPPQQSDIIPWSDLGVDSAAVAAMFTPRVFVSTDGEHFTEGSFPALPDGYQPGQFTVVTTANGYAATEQLYNPNSGGGVAAKLYTSTDGLTWTEADMPVGQYDSVNFLPNGTIVAFANAMPGAPSSQPFTAVSTDGVEWSKMSLAGLLDVADGKSAEINVFMAGAGPTGIAAVATISTDAAAEAGGLSVEKDGVRLTLTSSRYRAMTATDIATGDEIGSLDSRILPTSDARLVYASDGGVQVVSPDRTVRVTFDAQTLGALFDEANANTYKNVVLHSSDGINWSRDDVKPIAGFDTYGATRIQVTEGNVLVSFVDPNTRDAQQIPKTVVLVGTPKS